MADRNGVETLVTVGLDNRLAAIDPRGQAFGTVLSREQIEALSDDPAEMDPGSRQDRAAGPHG